MLVLGGIDLLGCGLVLGHMPTLWVSGLPSSLLGCSEGSPGGASWVVGVIATPIMILNSLLAKVISSRLERS